MAPDEPTFLGIRTFPLIARDEAHKVFGNAPVQLGTGREAWQGNEGGLGLLPAKPPMIRTEIGGRRPHEPDTHAHKKHPINWRHNSHPTKSRTPVGGEPAWAGRVSHHLTRLYLAPMASPSHRSWVKITFFALYLGRRIGDYLHPSRLLAPPPRPGGTDLGIPISPSLMRA